MHVEQALRADPNDDVSMWLRGDLPVALGRMKKLSVSNGGHRPRAANSANSESSRVAARVNGRHHKRHPASVKALRECPNFTAALVNLGVLRFRVERDQEASHLLCRAVLNHSRCVSARAALAMVLATSHDEQARNGAEEDRESDQARALSEGASPQTWTALAVARTETSKFELALDAAERAIRFAPPGSGLAKDLQTRIWPTIRECRAVRGP